MHFKRSRIFTTFRGAICLLPLLAASRVLANPTQDEVFRSINQNVGSTVDLSKFVPYVMLAIGAVIMAVLYNYRSHRKAVAKPLYHPGKLMREVAAKIDLQPAELQQLKLLAQHQKIEFPLSLLLCPSLLGKAVRAAGPGVDRHVLQGLVQRLRDGIGVKSEIQNPKSESNPNDE